MGLIIGSSRRPLKKVILSIILSDLKHPKTPIIIPSRFGRLKLESSNFCVGRIFNFGSPLYLCTGEARGFKFSTQIGHVKY